jgi:hypothetical protein
VGRSGEARAEWVWWARSGLDWAWSSGPGDGPNLKHRTGGAAGREQCTGLAARGPGAARPACLHRSGAAVRRLGGLASRQ